MPDSVHQVGVDFKVDPRSAMASLGALSNSVARLSSGFDRASRLVGGLAAAGGALGAAFSVAKIVEATRDHLGMVQRISDLTRTDVKTADALVETFSQVGLRGEDAERVLLGMSRRAAMMDTSMAHFGMQVAGTRAMFARMNIDVRKGIEPALVKMSALYKAGKVDVAQLGIAFGIPRQKALDFVNLLRQGPERIKEMIAEGKKFALGEGAMQVYQRMRLASNQVQATLRRVQVMIGSELLPVLAELLEGMSKKIREWLPDVKKFAEFLRDNLNAALSTVVTIGKVMLANYAVVKATAAMSALGIGAKTLPAGGLGIVSLAGALSAPALVGIAAAALVAWKAFQAIRDNALGVRDYLLSFWDRLKAHFAVIYKLLMPVAKLFSGDGAIGHFFTYVIVHAIESVADVIEATMKIVEVIIIAAKRVFDSPSRMLHPIDLFRESVAEAAKMHREALFDQAVAGAVADRRAPGDRPAPYMDFRFSRFDITQRFEEGFDPDRIAVAFSNELAVLGERRLQSGFSPLYAVR